MNPRKAPSESYWCVARRVTRRLSRNLCGVSSRVRWIWLLHCSLGIAIWPKMPCRRRFSLRLKTWATFAIQTLSPGGGVRSCGLSAAASFGNDASGPLMKTPIRQACRRHPRKMLSAWNSPASCARRSSRFRLIRAERLSCFTSKNAAATKSPARCASQQER